LDLSSPLQNQLVNITSLDFNFTVQDNLADSLYCNLTLNGKLNKTNLNVINNTLYNVTLSNLSEGIHTWNVSCLDNASNKNTSETRIFTVDFSAPTVTLRNPTTLSWYNTTSRFFNYTVSDVTGISNCTLVINNIVNKTNTSINNQAPNNFSVDGFNDGIYNWTVYCTDFANRTSLTDPYVFYIDTGPPSINLSIPYDGFISSENSLMFNFTATDALDPGLFCNITFNSTINNSVGLSVTNGNTYSYNQSGFTDGTFFWNVTCQDNTSNRNTSSTFNFTVEQKPFVILWALPNNTRTNNPYVSFDFRPIDNSGAIKNCTLVLNDQLNISNTTIFHNQVNNLTPGNLPHNTYYWTVNCSDYRGNIGTNYSIKTVYVDRKGPAIDLNFPTGGNLNYNDIIFNFTATDQFGLPTNLACNLTLDGKVNISGISLSSPGTNFTLISNLTNGLHSWNVTCKDDFNNTNTSLTYTFNVNAPDLTLNRSEIRFNDSLPSEIDTVTVWSTIYNIGGVDAENFLVEFFDGNPVTGGTRIGNWTISTLSFGQNITLNATFIPNLGEHEIFVVTDRNTLIDELNETNNNASVFYNVSIYQTIFGNSTGMLEIRDIVNQTVFAWNITQNPYGYLFVTDLEARITWSNISALGVTTALNNITNDFIELDLRLNTSTFNDSLNRTYTTNGIVNNDTDLTLFNRNLINVPFTPSGNASNFITGILWDVSDDNDGQYSGTEDIIFVSNFRRNSPGSFGTYDFEMKFPGRLSRYNTTDTTTVLFYAELI
jgi:hypothetical protein